VREELTLRWLATQRRVANATSNGFVISRRISAGRSLINALSSLEGGLLQEARTALRELGHDLEDIAAQEVDPGLGNGGLGRLAACFLDSLATLQYPAIGYGIRYDYGFSRRSSDRRRATRGRQQLAALRNVWETPRSNVSYRVRFGGRIEARKATHPGMCAAGSTPATSTPSASISSPRQPRCHGESSAALVGTAITPFHIDAFNAGDYAAAVREQVEAKNLSRVLYPDDSTPQGKELRLKQQYFFVSASLQDILATHLNEAARSPPYGFGRDPAERHAPDDRDSGTDAALDR